jgi:predicted SAM-dependent methyltransferase
MKWLAKAAVQKVIGCLPNAEGLNYFFQRHVTKNLPARYPLFCEKVQQAADHLSLALDHLRPPEVSKLVLYEFGAGWDLTIPLTYCALGISHQTVVDIRWNLKFELINAGLTMLSAHRTDLETQLQRPLVDLGTKEIRSVEDLRQRFGIAYLAPCDAKDTKLSSQGFDLITSTYTLEHIPPADILKILRECARLLKPNGVMSSLVDMRDHYAYFDPSVSVYNYLKFSSGSWKLVNSPIHYQNRLRYIDYVALVRNAGMQIVFQDPELPQPSECETLRSLNISDHFRSKYSLEELAPTRLRILSCNDEANLTRKQTTATLTESSVSRLASMFTPEQN